MSGNSGNKNVIGDTPMSLLGYPEVSFRKNDYEALIERHGYSVYLDKAIKCPCKSKNGEQALSSCLNCGGKGYVYTNRIETKMILQSMNIDTKYKQWSEEKIGTVRVTCSDIEQLGYMDRIVVRDSESRMNQVLYPILVGNQLKFSTLYDIKEITDIVRFNTDSTTLVRLVQDVDYYVEGGSVVRLNDSLKDIANLTISIRYTHSPQYYIIDLTREVMNVNVRDKHGNATTVAMPVSGVGRRSHYVLDENGITGQLLLDNSYAGACGYEFKFNPTGIVEIYNSEDVLIAKIAADQKYTLEPSSIYQAVEGGDPQFIQLLHPGEDFIIPIPPVTGGDVNIFLSDGTTLVDTITSPGSFTIPKHSIKRSDNTVIAQREFNQDSVIPDSVISDSNGVEITQVKADSQKSLPDVNHIDSDGVTVVPTPINTPFECTIVDTTVNILYSDGSTKVDTISAPTDYVIGFHRIFNSKNVELYKEEFDVDTVIADSKVVDSAGAIITTAAAEEDAVLPNFEVWNSEGTPCTQNRPLSLFLDHTVRASDGRANDVNGNLISLVPAGKTVIIPSGIVNRDGVPYGTVRPGQTINVPSAIVPSGILYQRPIINQKLTYRTGDIGWHQQNGSLNFSVPTNPATIQCLDMAAVDWFYTLKYDNAFGTKARFTNSIGGTPASGLPYDFRLTDFTGAISWYVIDHLTGMGIYEINLIANNTLWNSFIDFAHAQRAGNFLGFSDWMPMFHSLSLMLLPEVVHYVTNGSIFKGGLNGVLGGTNETLGMFLSDTRIQSAGSSIAMGTSSRPISAQKSSAIGYACYICRVHY